MNKLIESSKGDGSLSATFQGLIISLIPLAIIASKFFGVELSEKELVGLLQSITTAIAGVTITFGLIRKVIYKFKK